MKNYVYRRPFDFRSKRKLPIALYSAAPTPAAFISRKKRIYRPDIFCGIREHSYPVGAVLLWYDPLNQGLPVVGAYRAINSVGTPWSGGPTNYADTLINQANPGVNDLVEGNGVVLWIQTDGWLFITANAKYFRTGIIAGNGWTILVQCKDSQVGAGLQVDTGAISTAGGVARFYVAHDDGTGAAVAYAQGTEATQAPSLVTGGLAVSNQQGFRNGAFEANIVAGLSPIVETYIGALNLDGLSVSHTTTKLESVVIYNGVLTSAQISAVNTAMSQL